MKPISDENYYFSYEYYDESTDVAYQNLHKDKVKAIRKWLPYSHPNKNYYDALPLANWSTFAAAERVCKVARVDTRIN